MFTQASFTFSAPPAPPADDEVTRLERWLRDHPGFHTAAAISATLEMPDRKIRQLAEAADGLIVSGPGSPGYCHLTHCPVEIVARVNDAMISQGKRMIRRGIRSRNRAHTLIR